MIEDIDAAAIIRDRAAREIMIEVQSGKNNIADTSDWYKLYDALLACWPELGSRDDLMINE